MTTGRINQVAIFLYPSPAQICTENSPEHPGEHTEFTRVDIKTYRCRYKSRQNDRAFGVIRVIAQQSPQRSPMSSMQVRGAKVAALA
jgi:hypothetical protein